jgi:hypothetical protein
VVEDSVEEIVLGGNKLRRLLYGQRLEALGLRSFPIEMGHAYCQRETCLRTYKTALGWRNLLPPRSIMRIRSAER